MGRLFTFVSINRLCRCQGETQTGNWSQCRLNPADRQATVHLPAEPPCSTDPKTGNRAREMLEIETTVIIVQNVNTASPSYASNPDLQSRILANTVSLPSIRVLCPCLRGILLTAIAPQSAQQILRRIGNIHRSPDNRSALLHAFLLCLRLSCYRAFANRNGG